MLNKFDIPVPNKEKRYFGHMKGETHSTWIYTDKKCIELEEAGS
jgi:hypothetical protein